MRPLPFLAATFAAASLFACTTTEDSKTAIEVPMARSTSQRETAPALAPGDAEALREGNTAFATDLYQTLRKDPSSAGKNLFFSPHSISTALAMTYAGARGTTATEMAATMHYELPQDRLHQALNALDLALESRGAGHEAADGKGFRLHTTNSLWGAPQLTFEAPFLDVLAKSYGTGVYLADFERDAESARGTINGWVGYETEDRIKDLLPAGSISSATRLVLVNAIYFNASWQVPFTESETKKATFHGAVGDVQVDMMSTTGEFAYAESDSYRAVALPYAGDEVSLVAILPNDLASFESTFSAKQAESIARSLAPAATFHVQLPKFKIEGESVSLKRALAAQGMKQAFADSADFSGISATERLVISDVIHQAVISVDEKRTEAAAATGVVEMRTSLPVVVELAFDKPFVFFVRDNVTGAILFLGRMQTL